MRSRRHLDTFSWCLIRRVSSSFSEGIIDQTNIRKVFSIKIMTFNYDRQVLEALTQREDFVHVILQDIPKARIFRSNSRSPSICIPILFFERLNFDPFDLTKGLGRVQEDFSSIPATKVALNYLQRIAFDFSPDEFLVPTGVLDNWILDHIIENFGEEKAAVYRRCVGEYVYIMGLNKLLVD